MLSTNRPGTAYLSPFAMEVQRICWRFSSVTDTNVDLTWRLHQVAVDSTSVNEVAEGDDTQSPSDKKDDKTDVEQSLDPEITETNKEE